MKASSKSDSLFEPIDSPSIREHDTEKMDSLRSLDQRDEAISEQSSAIISQVVNLKWTVWTHSSNFTTHHFKKNGTLLTCTFYRTCQSNMCSDVPKASRSLFGYAINDVQQEIELLVISVLKPSNWNIVSNNREFGTDRLDNRESEYTSDITERDSSIRGILC